VGDKKRKNRIGDENQHDDENVDGESADVLVVRAENDNESDDDDLGRTATGTESRSKLLALASRSMQPLLNQHTITSSDTVPKVNKGKGKRERLRHQEKNQINKVMTLENFQSEQENEEKGFSMVQQKGEEKTNTTSSTNNARHDESNKMRKRKKVRSKQKNIRKDHRITKPEYLIASNTSDYRGRPLTPETRSRLNLPPSRSHMRVTQYHDPHSIPGVQTLIETSGLPPLGWKHAQKEPTLNVERSSDSLLLKHDTPNSDTPCLPAENSIPVDSLESIPEPSKTNNNNHSQSEGSMKIKKSKYKNLCH
jgi:hypothetical protein